MRVLHINISYTVSLLHQTMIEHLNQLGIRSKVFVPTYDRTKSIVECEDYVTLCECFKKWDRFFYFKKQKKIINAVLENYDVSFFNAIHAYTLFTDGNVAMELSKKYGIPYVVAIRNTDVNIFFKKMIHLRSHGVKILRNASAIFFLSPAYRETVLAKYVPKEYKEEIKNKSYIIPNGIDDFWLKNANNKNIEETAELIKKKELRGIYVGNIDANKNVELTLKALEMFAKEGWKCTLTAVGKIIDRKVYDQLCGYSSFCYVRPQKKEELIRYYRENDVFIMPSHTETFGLVYAEAISQGLPVIYTNGQGFDGQFAEGEVGYHVNDNNVQDVVQKIRMIINDYKDISLNCTIASSKYDWNIISKRYRDIYLKILC